MVLVTPFRADDLLGAGDESRLIWQPGLASELVCSDWHPPSTRQSLNRDANNIVFGLLRGEEEPAVCA